MIYIKASKDLVAYRPNAKRIYVISADPPKAAELLSVAKDDGVKLMYDPRKPSADEVKAATEALKEAK